LNLPAHADPESIHWHTPSLRVRDGRELTVRQVDYLRSTTGANVRSRVTRQRYTPAGLLMEQRDPRFTDAAKANLTQVYTLTGAPLKVDSVDAGWRLTLPGPAGESLQLWDGRGQHWLSTYDEQLRVLTVGVDGELPLENFTYADVSADAARSFRHPGLSRLRFAR
jgi:insecticidal toxin complex protein TccC